MHFSFFHLQVALWRGWGAMEVVARGAMEGKIVSNFSKRLQDGAAAQQQGCAKMNTDFRFLWVWSVFWGVVRSGSIIKLCGNFYCSPNWSSNWKRKYILEKNTFVLLWFLEFLKEATTGTGLCKKQTCLSWSRCRVVGVQIYSTLQIYRLNLQIYTIYGIHACLPPIGALYVTMLYYWYHGPMRQSLEFSLSPTPQCHTSWS